MKRKDSQENGARQGGSDAEWMQRIEHAPSEREVIGLVQAYLESREPREIEVLPQSCAPARVASAPDLTEYAYRLAAFHGAGEGGRAAARLAAVVGRASVRLATIARERQGPPSEM